MWEVLGIGATDDPAAIRRAYAVRLKTLDPDRDPEGFRSLRQAYESALARAQRARKPAVSLAALIKVKPEIEAKPDLDAADESEIDARESGEAHRRVARVPSERDKLLANAQAESAAVLSKFRRSLLDRDWTAAAAQLVSASARGLLPLADEEALAAEVMTGAMADRGLSPARLRSLAEQVRWDGPLPWNRGAHDKIRQQVQERLDAETWYARLVEQAAYRAPWSLNLRRRMSGDPKQIERRVAMMVLGWAPQTDVRHFKRWLDPLLAQAERYQPWLGNRIDPVVIEALRNLLARPPRPASTGYWFVWVMIGIGLLQLLSALANNH